MQILESAPLERLVLLRIEGKALNIDLCEMLQQSCVFSMSLPSCSP